MSGEDFTFSFFIPHGIISTSNNYEKVKYSKTPSCV